MGDMLIRNIDDNLKRQLQDSARRSGRSLSEEAIHLMATQIVRQEKSPSAGERLRGLLGKERLDDEELDAIAASRVEPDRPPPAYDP